MIGPGMIGPWMRAAYGGVEMRIFVKAARQLQAALPGKGR